MLELSTFQSTWWSWALRVLVVDIILFVLGVWLANINWTWTAPRSQCFLKDLRTTGLAAWNPIGLDIISYPYGPPIYRWFPSRKPGVSSHIWWHRRDPEGIPHFGTGSEGQCVPSRGSSVCPMTLMNSWPCGLWSLWATQSSRRCCSVRGLRWRQT